MGSLLLTAERLQSLTSQLQQFEWLVALQASLDTFQGNVNELDILEAIDLYLEDSLGFAGTFKSWLEANAIPEAALKVLWNHLEQRFDEQAATKYRPLLQTFEAVQSAGNQAEVLNWPLLEFETNSNPIAGADIGLGFEIDSSLDLMIYGKAKDNIPDSTGLNGNGCLTIKIDGKLSGKLAAWLPFRLGSASLSSNACSQIEACYYYKHKLSSRVVKALTIDLREVPFPFSVKQLATAFEQSTTFHAISLRSNRRFIVNGQLQLVGTQTALYKGVSLENLGLSVGFDTSSDLATQFQIYQENLTAQRWLVVEVSRQRDQATGLTGELGIELNAQQHAQAVAEVLAEHLKELKDLLDMLRLEAIAEGSFINERLFQGLEKLSADRGWQTVIGILKGDNEGSELSQYLKTQMTEQIEANVSTFDQRIKNALDQFVAQQQANVGNSALSALAEVYIPDFSARLIGQLNRYTNDLSGSLVKRLADSDQSERLADAVEKAGIKIEKTSNDLRAKLIEKIQPIETLIRKYFKYVEKLQSAAEIASKANIKAAISYQRRRQKQSSLLMKVRIKWDALERFEDILQQMLLGDTRPLLQAYRQGTTDIELETGLLTTVATSNRSLGFAVTLMNFEITGQKLLDTETVIEKNYVSGEITITSKAVIEKRSQAFGNCRNIRFIDVMRLASSGVLPTAAISLTINRQEEKLERQELSDFLGSLVQAELISTKQKVHAEGAIYSAHENRSGGYVGDAQLTLGFNLSTEEMEILLAVVKQNNGLVAIFDIVKNVLEDLDIVNHKYVREFQMIYHDQVTDVDGLMMFAFEDHFKNGDKEHKRVNQRSHPRRNNSSVSAQYLRLKPYMNNLYEWMINIQRLFDALVAMNEVVTAGAGKNKDFYENRQLTIAKNMSEWVKIRGAFFGVDTIREETLALMLVLSRLVGANTPEFVPLSLTLSYQRNNREIAVDLLPL